MDKVSFGKLFKLIRTEKGISQSELSYGICTPRTIYNIEKGANIPSIELMLHFANKLDFDFLSILSYSNSENGLLYYKKFREMESLYETDQYELLEKEVDMLLSEGSDLSPYQYQILHWYKGICAATWENPDFDAARDEFVLALSFTREYDIHDAARHFCTLQELHIINSFAILMFLKNNLEQSRELYIQLLENLVRYGENSNDPLYIKISYNLAKCLNRMNRSDEALDVCRKGIALARKHNILNSLADLYIELGNTYGLLGEIPERDRAFKSFIYLYELCGKRDMVKDKKSRFREKYQIVFDDI